ALCKKPEERFPSVVAMSDALERVLGERASAGSTAQMPRITVGDGPASSVSITVVEPSRPDSEKVADRDDALAKPRSSSRARGWLTFFVLAGGAGGGAYWWHTQREGKATTSTNGGPSTESSTLRADTPPPAAAIPDSA